jgi:hypothetical protein
MSSETLERRFAAIGARLKVAGRPWRGAPRIDIRSDARGEYFDLRFTGGERGVEVEVVDVQPRDRHLLLLARVGGEKSKFLCGHDERHWFVAAVPEAARGVNGVVAAKAALQPDAVRELVERMRPKDAFRRRNPAYVRQGEWFFVPAAGIDPPEALVRREEPLTRGRGTAHVLQFAYRRGGVVVYVSDGHPTGISEARYARLTPEQRRNGDWELMVADPELYAKGAVRHPDHATIHLAGWHRVLMNTEQGALAMRHVAFLD